MNGTSLGLHRVAALVKNCCFTDKIRGIRLYKKVLVLLLILLISSQVSAFCIFGFGDCGGQNFFIIDKNTTTIDQNITNNYTGGDLNWSQLNTVIPWVDANVSNDLTINGYVTDSIFNAAFPVDWDTNISNRPYIVTEANIDENALAVVNSLDLNASLNYSVGSHTIDTNYATEGFDFADYLLTTTFIPSTAAWDSNYLANVWNTDFNANWLDLFTGQNNSLLTNDAGFITSYIDTNASVCGTGQVLGGLTDGCVDTNSFSSASAIAVEVYYPTDHNSDIATYETLQSFPDTNSESDSASVSSGTGQVLIDQYMTAPMNPGVTIIPAGTYTFNSYVSISSSAGETFFDVNVYKYDSNGLITPFFGTTTTEVNEATSTLYTTTYVLPTDQTIAIDARFIVRYYVRNNHATAKTATLYYGGANAYSYIITSLPKGGSGFVRYIGSTENLLMSDYNITANTFFGSGSELTGIVHPFIPTEATIDANINAIVASRMPITDANLSIPSVWSAIDGNSGISWTEFGSAGDGNYLRIGTFIPSTAAWDANYLANVFNADFNANWLDLFTGQNISLLTNDSGFITSYTDTNTETSGFTDSGGKWVIDLNTTENMNIDQNLGVGTYADDVAKIYVLTSGNRITPNSGTSFLFQHSENTSSSPLASLISGDDGASSLTFGIESDQLHGRIIYNPDEDGSPSPQFRFIMDGSTPFTLKTGTSILTSQLEVGQSTDTLSLKVIGGRYGNNIAQFTRESSETGLYMSASNLYPQLNFKKNVRWSMGIIGGNIFTIDYNSNIGFSGGVVWINPNKYVGIGKNPAYQLELSTNSAGKPTSSLWTIVSDKRIKENVTTIESALDKINQLRPVTFNFIKDYRELHDINNNTYSGFIAQEYETVFPNAVNIKGDIEKIITPEIKDENGLITTAEVKEVIVKDAKDLNEGDLIAYLTKAIQELFGWNTTQDTRITELETENEEMQTTISLIKSEVCKKDNTYKFCTQIGVG